MNSVGGCDRRRPTARRPSGEFCIQNDDLFAWKMMDFVLKMMNFASKMMDFVLKMMILLQVNLHLDDDDDSLYPGGAL